MSVWISDEKLLIFASLISPSKMILFENKYQTFDTVFHHQMKHLDVRQKYSAACRIFNSLLSVSSSDETLHLMFDILLIHFFTCQVSCPNFNHTPNHASVAIAYARYKCLSYCSINCLILKNISII